MEKIALKIDVCGRHASLASRLRLFNATVTPTMLYGSGCWTMTSERERMLRSTQRRMLRWILGSVWRRPSQTDTSSETSSDLEEPPEDDNTEKADQESWVEWVKRCTHVAEAQLRRVAVDDWVTAQRRRKWRLAGHTARRQDNRWSEVLLGWEPASSNRGRGHPCKRWTTDLDSFFYARDGRPRWVWKHSAQDRTVWQNLEDDFVANAWYK